MKVRSANLLFAIACITLQACGLSGIPYSVSPQNVTDLSALSTSGKRIHLAPLETANGPIQQVKCRLTPIRLPNDETFESYLYKALLTEMKLSSLESPDAAITLRGTIEVFDSESNVIQDSIMSSFLGGRWTIRIRFTPSIGEPFVVSHESRFSTAYNGDLACERVVANLVPSVQAFISKMIHNEQFVELVK